MNVILYIVKSVILRVSKAAFECIGLVRVCAQAFVLSGLGWGRWAGLLPPPPAGCARLGCLVAPERCAVPTPLATRSY